jgi:hypothetical protein
MDDAREPAVRKMIPTPSIVSHLAPSASLDSVPGYGV